MVTRKTELSQDEVVELIGKAMLEMDGEELADLYNREFGDNMKYVGDSQFEQEWNEEDDEEDSSEEE